LPLSFSLFGGLRLLLESHTLLPRVVFQLQSIFFLFSGPKLLPEWPLFLAIDFVFLAIDPSPLGILTMVALVGLAGILDSEMTLTILALLCAP
jgi:hypothetical protein